MASIETWSSEAVCDWLGNLGLEQYSDRFLEERVDGHSLIVLNYDMCKELNINLVGHRLKLLNAIYRLKKEQGIRFQERDYIPARVSPTLQQMEIQSKQLEALKRYTQEKDLVISQLKEKIKNTKTELAYFQPKQLPKLTLDTSQYTRKANSPTSATSSAQYELTIRIYGNQLPNKITESYKTFRIGPNDDCIKVISDAIQKYKIGGDWKDYVLLLVIKDQDNLCLNPQDKIQEICQEQIPDEQVPTFIIQHTRLVNGPISKPLNLDPGTFLAASLSSNPVAVAIGIYDYEAQSREELDVQIGATYSVLARDGEWSVVERNGQRGSVPTNTIYEIEKADRSQAQQTVKCLYEYTKKSKYELTIQPGEVLIVHERYHHWYLVQHFGKAADEESMGLVPFSCITIIDESESATIKSAHLSPRPSPIDQMAPSESYQASVQELEKYIKQWEQLLSERPADLDGSAKTLKDTRKLIQYVFKSTSPIQHIILKRPLHGIVSFTLEEICKKNQSRWVQYNQAIMAGVSQQDLDALLFASIRKNYSALMKIVNMVLEDEQVAPLIMKRTEK